MQDKHFKEEIFISQHNSKTVFRIIGLALKNPVLFAGMNLFIIATAFCHNYSTYLKKIMVDEGLLNRNFTLFTNTLILYGILFVSVAFTFFLAYICAGVLCEKLQFNIRRQLFAHMQTLPFAFFDKTPTGWILNRLTNDTTKLAELGTWMILDTIWAATNIIFALYFMFRLNIAMTLIVLLAIPVLIFIAVYFKKFILHAYRNVQASQSELTALLHENITGVKIIKGLVKEAVRLQEFSSRSEKIFKSGFRAAWLSSLFIPIVQTVALFITAGIILFSGLKGTGIQNGSGTITIGIIQVFAGYIIFIMWPVQEIARVYSQMQQGIAGAERIFSFLGTTPEIVDSAGAIAPQKFQGNVEFRNVHFYYTPGTPVLENFSLQVAAGETIALVGPTGGGKTTIINLLCRFLEPNQGSIFIDGRDYREYSLHALHSSLGVVLQTPHLFSGTIRENIRYGKQAAGDEEIYAAARIAHAEEFILQLPKGFDTEVGEEGNNLSAGQKQLISLCRAILVKPVFLIMDEPTSAVDYLTETLTRKAMDEFRRTCTSFIIAHRLTTIKNADRILVIEKGRIVETGTHSQLIVRGGKYYQLYAEQFRQEKEQEYAAGSSAWQDQW